MGFLANIKTKLKQGWEKTSKWIKTTASKVVQKFRGLSTRDKIKVGVGAVVPPVGLAMIGYSIAKKHLDPVLGVSPSSNPTQNNATYRGQEPAKKGVSPFVWLAAGGAALLLL